MILIETNRRSVSSNFFRRIIHRQIAGCTIWKLRPIPVKTCRNEADFTRRKRTVSLVKDGVLSLAEAAKRLGMTEEELKSKMS